MVCRLVLILVTFLAANALSHAETNQIRAGFWDTPVPSQSPPPPEPETCGACHIDKYSDWQRSRHAHAFSAGLLGQIIDYDIDDATSCLNCHAPLAEQQSILSQSDFETLASDTRTQRHVPLAQHGVFCAVCHLRDGVLHAPSIAATDKEAREHQDIVIEPSMRDSRFCSGCHQFEMETAINGKPLQNTYREWLDSAFARQGITCQSCHMPDGAHLFRGIHDPGTVRNGLSISTQRSKTFVDLVVQSTGVGHRFPTYSVARVRLTATLFDSSNRPIPDGEQELVLQRRMSLNNGQWIELSDTRLAPGESAILRTPIKTGDVCAAKTAFKVIVDPEWYYHDQVYPSVMDELEDGHARNLLSEAKLKSEERRYVLFEQVVHNECGH